jgi:protocatechuate 3,4-dioxygenase beta subunit
MGDDGDRSLPRGRGTAISRRDALRWVGSALAAGPLSSFAGCDQDPEGPARVDDAGSGAAAGKWASGGTSAMIDLASYPDPFASMPDMACTPTCSMTLGPCHDDQAPEREDISEGHTGLPVRFGLRIVDESCRPVSDANVDIWHCDPDGAYSSETTDVAFICGVDNAAALAARWFRGHRMTDENGIVWFNTCFPGWYSGRAVHVHFTIRRSSRSGEEYLTSQLAFQDSLINEICGEHPDYTAHGLPDTATMADGIFPADGADRYAMETDRMPDGAMLAWKTIVIRSALTEGLCAEGGQGGSITDLLDGLFGG